MSPLRSFLEINGIETHVACWGRWVEEDEPDEVIIMIPGNPGLAGFYYPYLEELHKITQLPVWVLGHAGHEEPPMSKIGAIKHRESSFNLNGQFKHKVDFVEKYTKQSTKVHLLGHSIGAWIALEMLKEFNVSDRIQSVNLLFPTIQQMAKTRNGFILNTVIRKIKWFILLAVWLASLIPNFIKCLLISLYFYMTGIPNLDIFIKTATEYLKCSVVKKVLFMAFDEMDKVKQLDMENVMENRRKIKMVYGDKDGWAPASLFKTLEKLVPNLYIKNVPFQHAFCMTSYIEMASITADLLKKD